MHAELEWRSECICGEEIMYTQKCRHRKKFRFTNIIQCYLLQTHWILVEIRQSVSVVFQNVAYVYDTYGRRNYFHTEGQFVMGFCESDG